MYRTYKVYKVYTATILLSASLTACSSLGPQQPPVPVSAALASVPCSALPRITFAAPKSVAGVTAWQAGRLTDAGNHFDTVKTVEQIRLFDAVQKAICGP